MDKLLKDPVYGYISVDKNIMDRIVDDSAFQRLRHIGQTSYTPLYSSALHNRFVHSLGVYNLGRMVSSSLEKSIEDADIIDINLVKSLKKTFELACLLHDVGHSPFSHTGENFYLKKHGSKDEALYNNLTKIIDNDNFSNDFEDSRIKKTLGKPHEIMSAYLGIKLYSELIDDLDFFARCIIGLLYRDEKSYDNQIKNIFIQLLNSSCIDVDKIDYLLRDAYVTGFDTISIDYFRLLKSVVIRKYICDRDDGTPFVKYKLAFKKSAVSVLENVVYAHDSERKWIQNHPTVLYENYIITHAIEVVSKYYQNIRLDVFTYEALLEEGVENEEGVRISLICDDDFIYTMKNCIQDELVNEYFNRKLRRHPVWKSESEFLAYFVKKGDWISSFNRDMSFLDKYLKEEECVILDDKILESLKTKKKFINNNTDISNDEKQNQIARYDRIYNIVNKLKTIANSLDLEFNFVIINSDIFKSGFSKKAIKELLIDFNNIENEITLKSITTLLDADVKEYSDFYYIFYKRTTEINTYDFAQKIFEQFR